MSPKHLPLTPDRASVAASLRDLVPEAMAKLSDAELLATCANPLVQESMSKEAVRAGFGSEANTNFLEILALVGISWPATAPATGASS